MIISKLVKNAKNKLTDQKVNILFLDCSDAHRFSDSKDKDRIYSISIN